MIQRKKIVAGNWKMNKNYEEANYLIFRIVESIAASDTIVVIAPPFINLKAAYNVIHSMPIFKLGAQNCYINDYGAFTGEISVPMLQSVGVQYVIVGHSERREYFSETNNIIAQKIDTLLQHNMTPIFCCGEPSAIRDQNSQRAYVEKQLQESLFHLSSEQVEKVVIAYEPIWAIGTGKTATSAQAQEMHQDIRKMLSAKYSDATAQKISILYGGSCKPSNAKELFAQPDVDGGLIGGASLVAEDFAAIVKACTD
ncbi:MAG: triose-phosphate isomerase [Saprospiraceae bacterium]